MYPMSSPEGDSATRKYSGHLQIKRQAPAHHFAPQIAKQHQQLPCQVLQVEGDPVGLRQRVHVDVVEAEHVVARELAKRGHRDGG